MAEEKTKTNPPPTSPAVLGPPAKLDGICSEKQCPHYTVWVHRDDLNPYPTLCAEHWSLASARAAPSTTILDPTNPSPLHHYYCRHNMAWVRKIPTPLTELCNAYAHRTSYDNELWNRLMSYIYRFHDKSLICDCNAYTELEKYYNSVPSNTK